MEAILTGLIAKLDPSNLVLLIILYGVWKVMSKFMDQFSKQQEELVSTLKEMKNDLHGLAKDVSVIVNRVDAHEKRIEKIESKLD
jgi:uncharacterized protein Yka (UPF0111/DUF47 family)